MCRFFTIIFFSILLCLCLSTSVIAISAKHAYICEFDTGCPVFASNENARVSMASTTKIMTAIVAIENYPLSKTIKIPKEAVGIEGYSIYLQEGECLTFEDLLYALLLESANDSAVAIAISVSGSVDSFVELMNNKASELGLSDTHFSNPHGLDDENHYTTAKELAIIATYAMKNPLFAEIVSTYKRVIRLGDNGSRVLINHNKLLRSFDGTLGIKTGFTKKSGRCLVSCAERDGVKLVCVTINAPSDWSDHKELLELGFSKFENIKLANAGDYILSLDVINGKKSSILCTNFDNLNITLPKSSLSISAHLESNRLLSAPIKQGDYVGKIVYKNYNEEIASLNLYALEGIKEINYKKSLFERIFNNGKN